MENEAWAKEMAIHQTTAGSARSGMGMAVGRDFAGLGVPTEPPLSEALSNTLNNAVRLNAAIMELRTRMFGRSQTDQLVNKSDVDRPSSAAETVRRTNNLLSSAEAQLSEMLAKF